MRMHDNDSDVDHDSYSGGWISRCWVALYDMPDDGWEYIRMAENDWERLTSKGNWWGGGHSMRVCTLYDMHETEWEFFRLSHNWWTCMWWYGMTMHGNVWYWLIFKVTWPVGSVAATNGSSTSHSDTKMPTPGEHAPTILAKYPIIDEHVCDENAWQWLRGWAWLIFRGWVDQSMLSCTIRHAGWWMGMHQNGWGWLNDSHPMRMGGVVVILCGYVHYTTCTILNENSSDMAT